MISVDTSNQEFKTALSFVNQTGRHIFLTGKAGTGKTTFLRYIRERSFKKMAVVAPTGVAAINAGGVTIHSFFQIPPGTFLPTAYSLPDGVDQRIINKHSLLSQMRMGSEKKELLRELELLVIDEVSMVRADLLDAIDTVLRFIRKKPSDPFGGVQVLYIGDLFQLPPVVRNGEWKLLEEFYESPFFFNAQVVKEETPVYLELKKVYRQKDDDFISILNNIRNNICSASDLDRLHQHYHPTFIPHKDDQYITLTTHNEQANIINQRELRALPGRLFTSSAEISGEFPENSFPAEQNLELKKGAQIMFIKNDRGETRRYFNGKIGIIDSIEDDKLIVSFPNEIQPLELKKETWENIRYYYNKDKDNIEEEELGSFKQYPIRLAWAITIHKSQGLTFDKAVIDAGAAFAAGQVYVALSRLTSLQGLVLKSKIYQHCIQTDQRVIRFTGNALPENELQQVLEWDQQEFIKTSLVDRFGWEKLIALMEEHIEGYEHRTLPEKTDCIAFSMKLLARLQELQEIAQKFRKQLQSLLVNCEQDGYRELSGRVSAATTFFIAQGDEKLINPLSDQINKLKIKGRVQKYLKELREVLRQMMKRKQEFQNLQNMVNALQGANGQQEIAVSLEQIHQPIIIENLPAISVKKERGESDRITLQMFKDGMSIADIAAARSLVTGTIEGHLIGFIATGEIDVLDMIEEEKLNSILSLMEEHPTLRSAEIREKLGEEYSYNEIRAVFRYKEKLSLEQNADQSS